jgi:hypothetical protein
MDADSRSAGALRACLALALWLPACAAPAAREPAWIPLFDGRSLDGWTAKIRGLPAGEDPLRTFRVEDGVLRVCYDEYEEFAGRFGHLFHELPWSHYRLRLEYRFVGAQTPGGPGWAFRNSGIMIHGQSAASMALDQEFPVSIEVQLLGGDGEHPRPTANLCTPGTHVEMDGELVTQHCTDSASRTFHGDDWVAVEIEVRGAESVRHYVAGELVLEYQRPQLDPGDADAAALIRGGAALLLERGTVSLQAESHPVEFRRVEVQPLRP